MLGGASFAPGMRAASQLFLVETCILSLTHGAHLCLCVGSGGADPETEDGRRGGERETKGRRRRRKEKPGAFCEHVVLVVEAVTR